MINGENGAANIAICEGKRSPVVVRVLGQNIGFTGEILAYAAASVDFVLANKGQSPRPAEIQRNFHVCRAKY